MPFIRRTAISARRYAISSFFSCTTTSASSSRISVLRRDPRTKSISIRPTANSPSCSTSTTTWRGERSRFRVAQPYWWTRTDSYKWESRGSLAADPAPHSVERIAARLLRNATAFEFGAQILERGGARVAARGAKRIACRGFPRLTFEVGREIVAPKLVPLYQALEKADHAIRARRDRDPAHAIELHDFRQPHGGVAKREYHLNIGNLLIVAALALILVSAQPDIKDRGRALHQKRGEWFDLEDACAPTLPPIRERLPLLDESAKAARIHDWRDWADAIPQRAHMRVPRWWLVAGRSANPSEVDFGVRLLEQHSHRHAVLAA